MRYGRDEIAYRAGLTGEFYMPISANEIRSYREGVRDRPSSSNFIWLVIAYWLFLRPVFHYSFYIFLAYYTTTKVYFKKFSEYWNPPHYEFGNTILLLVTTYILSYFYVCFGYYLRAKMDSSTTKSSEKWTTLTATLFILEVAGPTIILFYLIMNTHFIHNYLLLVICSFSAAVLYFIYLLKRYNKRMSLKRDDISEYLLRAYDFGKGDPNHPVIPINWGIILLILFISIIIFFFLSWGFAGRDPATTLYLLFR